MHSYYLYNFLTFFYMYSAKVLISVPVGPRPVYDSDVVEPKIPTGPIVAFFIHTERTFPKPDGGILYR